MPKRQRKKPEPPPIEQPVVVIEQAPEELLTPERILAIARRNGHVVGQGARYVIDIDYAAWCSTCGAEASWVDEEAKTEMNPFSVFMRVYNKPCGALGRT
jgi:hypothetical protein